jgi:hypothetical protein
MAPPVAVFPEKTPYRIFISYSHEDRDLVRELREILRANGLEPMSDHTFAFGSGFPEQIKLYIAHSHVFLPVITLSSSKRKWVHQEIGFALAHNIPILPLTIGDCLPDAMMRELHAIRLSVDPKTDLALCIEEMKSFITKEMIEALVSRYRDIRLAHFQCAEFTEDRAALLAEYANDVRGLGGMGIVRQKGGLSSFHIPREVITHRIWVDRYGPLGQGPLHRRSLREERIALEEHAKKSGSRLIVNPCLDYIDYGQYARKCRLKWLLNFLEKTDAGKIAQVAIPKKLESNLSITIVGDWFYAESQHAKLGQGYSQTIFSRHAPSIQSKIDLFDQEFDELLEDRGWDIKDCREKAIEYIRKIKNKINIHDSAGTQPPECENSIPDETPLRPRDA